MKYPVLDNHMHLSPEGGGPESLAQFERAGGTHAILVHMPYGQVKIRDGEDFRREYEITLDMAARCRRMTGVRVYVFLGPYPGYMAWLWDELGPEKAEEVMREGMEIAAELAAGGKALGMGEIGRPHFPVAPDIWEASNRVLEYGMRLAREAGCAVQLHTESAVPETWEELAGMADRAGLPRERVIKHYSGPAVLESENLGLFPSVLASRKNIIQAAEKGSRFMMETDFLDDPRRPGAVMAPATVPKRTRAFLEQGIFDDELVASIHKDWPEKIYRIEID